MDAAVVFRIAKHLGPAECARASAVCKVWQEACRANELWSEHCRRDYYIEEAKDPFNQPLHDFWSAYRSWRLPPALPRGGEEGGRAWVRAARFWNGYKLWAAANFPALLDTLQEGGSEDELQQVENAVNGQMSPGLWALYRIHAGQSLPQNSRFELGMLRGHKVGLIESRMQLVPPRGVIRNDLPEDSRRFFELGRGICTSADGRTLMVEVKTGRLLAILEWPLAADACGARMTLHGRLKQKNIKEALFNNRLNVPMIRAYRKMPAGNPSEEVLCWLEQYLEFLEDGTFRVESHGDEHESNAAISLFGTKPPYMVEQVTGGVRVRVSVLFLSDVSDDILGLRFAYCVQCYLLSEEEQRKHAAAGGVHFRPVTEVQLLRPHLFIRDSEDGTVQVLYTTDAELHHPLSMGGEKFELVSLTCQWSQSGVIEGHLDFVEDDSEQPSPRKFQVQCPRIKLDFPQFIF